MNKQPIPSGDPRYHRVSMFFHWSVASVIFVVAGLGLAFDWTSRPTRAVLINLHVCIGLVLLLLIALRIGWRIRHAPPPYPDEWSKPSLWLAHSVHLILYALLALVPVLGLIARVWHGRDFDFGLFRLDFGVASARSVYMPAEEIHGLLAYVLLGLIGVHVLATLFHRFVLRDATLDRMLPPRQSNLEKRAILRK